MTRRTNLLAALLALSLLFSLIAPAAAAGGEITIATPEDLIQLAKDCTLDSWSQGKRVVLTADIDLTGSAFPPIPTFGGTFDGQGHTISGLSLTGSGNVRGLFRYLQPGGTIQNLTVEGTIAPTDLQDTLGLLVGENRGQIRNCAAQGSVTGKNTVGGLVGCNQAGGQIINGTFTGTVTGEHYVGGIAGQNHGSVMECTNQGSINTQEQSDQRALEDLDSLEGRRWNAAENLPACTDIGGIAGFSDGILQSCRNTGAVGYEHVGYNVGGITGRQSGYLHGCENQGTILGRKDVGGIAGQLEPEIFLRYGEDTMTRLWTELGTLSDQMDTLLTHVSTMQTSATAQIRTMTDRAGDAQAATGDLLEAAKDWANGNLDQINDLSARLSWTLDQLAPILDTLTDFPSTLTKAVEDLQEAIDRAKEAGDLTGQAAADLQEALTDALDAADHLAQAMDHIGESQTALKNALGDPQAVETALTQLAQGVEEVGSAMDAFSRAMALLREGVAQLPDIAAMAQSFLAALAQLDTVGGQAAGGLRDMKAALEEIRQNFSGSLEDLSAALEQLKAAAGELRDASQAMHQAGEHLRDAVDDLAAAGAVGDDVLESLRRAGDRMKDAFALLETAGDDLYTMIDTLAANPTIQFIPIGSQITEKGDALDDALSALLGGAEDLTDELSTSSDQVTEDLRAINSQLRTITDLLRQASTARQTDTDPVEDLSDQAGSDQQTGCLAGSRNRGTVSGDINVAGIVGSMAIEYDFDPEDDLTETGERSLDVHFQTKAVTRDCVNEGEIVGKKDDTGGIVGRMDLGQVRACENYGAVTSTDGSYVGGIAGACWGTIRDSWARCTLSGKNYVGGVAGYATALLDCHTLVTVTAGSAYVGAVAGAVDEAGRVEGNTFTQADLGAIDGISYQGKAQPVAFETLCAAGAPAGFARMALRFVADGQEVAVVPFQYGKGIDSLPPIPAKEGYSAAWPDLDYRHLTASQTLEAIYTPYTSALTDGGELPEILVDGSFSAQAEVSHTSEETTWTDGQGQARTGKVYTVTVSDPVLETVTYTVHCRLPEAGKHYALWVRTDQGWQRQDSWEDGSYLLFTANQESVTFSLVEQDSLWIRCLAGALAAILVLLLLLLRRRKRKQTPPDAPPAQPESPAAPGQGETEPAAPQKEQNTQENDPPEN